MAYCVGFDKAALNKFNNLTGDDLYAEADKVFESYWETHRYSGTTCDFGGGAYLQATTAELTEEKRLHHIQDPNSFVFKAEDLQDATSSKIYSSSKIYYFAIALIPTLGLLAFLQQKKKQHSYNRVSSYPVVYSGEGVAN